MTQMIQSGTFYHSSGDVYEAVPEAGLERAARFFAFFIQQVDGAPEALVRGQPMRGEGDEHSYSPSTCAPAQH
jgi:hypothetical protein